jgi:hypothetical protein
MRSGIRGFLRAAKTSSFSDQIPLVHERNANPGPKKRRERE